MAIVYWSEDDGSISLPAHVDDAPADGSADVAGFTRYEVADTVTLTVPELSVGVDSIIEVLLRAGKATPVVG